MTTVNLAIQLRLDKADVPFFKGADLFAISHLPAGLWADLPDAVSELVYALHYAADAFDHFQENLSRTGGGPGVIGIAKLSARGLCGIPDKEGQAVE